MNKITKTIVVAVLPFLMISCNTQKTTEEKSTNEIKAVEVKNVERKSADNLDTLNNILINSLKNKDKYTYLSYCFTVEQEEKIAEVLTDPKQKKYFKREFGFSLHEEVAYFENLVNYIEKTNIDLTKVDYALIEAIDYNRSNYTPIVLKEVIIPIIQDGIERDIVYVAIQMDGRWYFTSELSL